MVSLEFFGKEVSSVRADRTSLRTERYKTEILLPGKGRSFLTARIVRPEDSDDRGKILCFHFNLANATK